ncbi:hypothetical protein [Dickeya lacustris]|uniref:DUF2946 domain-containing protein n=1 Tax=Dickeya lacustris TaxID=2259638 RepID=A0ABY8G6B4_9GAMM|nr:hypothetical protein [Dickeya lacustris]WFN55491.1 hypothetical protein O1Q98_18150 [Dickeya lacustris]
MTAPRYRLLSLHTLRHRSAWGWLLAICWLLLNSQLAIAGHRCTLTPTAAPVVVQHEAHRMPHHGATPDEQSVSQFQASPEASPLCEKHCLPDSASQDLPSLSLLALPVNDELLPVNASLSSAVGRPDALTPPVTGPPATIRFCRFRE